MSCAPAPGGLTVDDKSRYAVHIKEVGRLVESDNSEQQTVAPQTLSGFPLGKVLPIVLISFLLGAAVGVAGLCVYARYVWLPQYTQQMETQMMGQASPDWGSIFEEAQQEAETVGEQLQPAPTDYVNPFEGIGEEGVSDGEYVNPFDLLE